MTGSPRPDEVRPYRVGDLAAVVALETALFGAEAWDEGAWQELVTGPGRRAWVSSADAGEVVGYALTGLVGDFVELLRIGVRPDRRRAGVAAALLAAATAAARADGADRMLLEVSATNTVGVAFYAAHGFVRLDVRPRYYRDGSDALVLQRSLGPQPERTDQGGSARMEP